MYNPQSTNNKNIYLKDGLELNGNYPSYLNRLNFFPLRFRIKTLCFIVKLSANKLTY